MYCLEDNNENITIVMVQGEERGVFVVGFVVVVFVSFCFFFFIIIF